MFMSATSTNHSLGVGEPLGQVAVRTARMDPVHVVAEGVEGRAALASLEGGGVLGIRPPKTRHRTAPIVSARPAR